MELSFKFKFQMKWKTDTSSSTLDPFLSTFPQYITIEANPRNPGLFL